MIIYVANRGEIARRIIRTAKRLGFKTAVGYSDQDRRAAFVDEADFSVPLDGILATDTYLHQSKVLNAALELGADFLHPGYGFLSENASFVEKVEKTSIKFVGPRAEAMRKLGDKIGARKLAEEAKVSLLPAYQSDFQDEISLRDAALQMGFPILIKPSAGGGGKGMFLVRQEAEFLEALRSSKRLASSAFSDARVFLERYIEKARHIEVQIIGDHHGALYALGERECSVQRNHQKLIEEAPCIFLPEKVRQKIFDESIRLAKLAGYYSAGTVEWIWDGDQEIYFLEVNARLQVEHPVTEFVTGLDLVELQLKVARGDRLDLKLAPSSGHSIEVRLCAEDPSQDFLPSGGRIHRLAIPNSIRCDFGFREGDMVPMEFDSMMGKLIVHAENRGRAIEKMVKALEDFLCLGPKTNRIYLRQILSSDEFRSGNLQTRMLDRMPYRFDMSAAIRWLKDWKAASPISDFEENLDDYSPWGAVCRKTVSISYEEIRDRLFFHFPFVEWTAEIKRETRLSGVLASMPDDVRAPLPGRVVRLNVNPPENIKRGDLLLILEAMKMEIKIKAPRDGRILKFLVREGDQVAVDSLLVEWANE